MSLKTIREVTRITGVTENALRYYDEKNVLHPTIKAATGRKEWMYDSDAIRKIKQILIYKKVGLPIRNIKELIEEENEMKDSTLRLKLEELQKQRRELDDQIVIAEMLLLISEVTNETDSKAITKDDLIERLFEIYCSEGTEEED